MVSGPLTDGCYGRGQSRTAANRPRRRARSPMQIVCPNCTTSYQIADAAIGDERPFGALRALPDRLVRARRRPLRRRRIASRGGQPQPRPWRRSAPSLAGNRGRRPSPDATATGAGNRRPTTGRSLAADRSRPHDAGRRSRPVALADIPIPVERRAAAGAGRRRRAPAGSHRSIDNGPPDIESVAARRARAAARRRREPAAGFRCRLADRCAGHPVRGAARLAQGRRARMRRSSRRSIVPSGCR